MILKLVRPKLVTFDVTGTLLMTKLEEHYTEAGLQHGLLLDPNLLAGSFKSNFKKLSLEHPIYGKHTGLGWENWWRTIVYNIFKEQDQQVCNVKLEKVASSLIKCYGTSRCWHKYPGVIELLDYLKGRGIIMGVISNFDERLESVLASTKLRPYFSFVLTSYNLGIEKPHPSIFEEALKYTKELYGTTVLPEEAVHIGDTLTNDYLGAKKAGWNAILIKRDGRAVDETKVSGKDVYRGLEELKSYFDTKFSDVSGNTM
ncbi:rhythmically expressed gene 2 protein [Cephus cinctus]|uniref:Rhythmically expressed gene 2 protein n=1 Tax=Cephus cinctus TaxID=211228 RepID=A0AAJ7CFX3_CEPCN|nr:rhythmically expressed gene 2 protein [Cephus cinctus]